MYTYVQLKHFAVEQKFSHCKSAVLQFLKISVLSWNF